MEILQDTAPPSFSPQRHFRTLLVNFRRLSIDGEAGETHVAEHSWQDLLHAVAGMCSVALPDMELPAIYSSLTGAGTKCIILTAAQRDILKWREERTEVASGDSCRAGGDATETAHQPAPPPHTSPGTTTGSGSSDGDGDGDGGNGGGGGGVGCSDVTERSFLDIFSASDSSEAESAAEDQYSESRTAFLDAALGRRCHPPPLPAAEDCVAGCGCFLKLSSQPRASAVQVLLLAVRHRWRGRGLGSYLIQTLKDPAVVGHYDVMLTFADCKAEHFFTTHGFSDDPIITARYRDMVDHWENSTLMAYTPPFSGIGGSSGPSSTAALSLCEDHFKSWRDSAIASYSEQLCLMQRLRHEVVLLHSKLQSREALVSSLTQQLQQCRREKASLELEFASYRKHSQKLLCEAAAGNAQDWLDSVAHSNSS